jgi:hypothetical protein
LSTRFEVTTAEVGKDALNIEIGRIGKIEQARITSILKRLSWSRKTSSRPPKWVKS